MRKLMLLAAMIAAFVPYSAAATQVQQIEPVKIGIKPIITVYVDTARVCGNEQSAAYLLRARAEANDKKRELERQGFDVRIEKTKTTTRTFESCRYN